MSTIRALLTLCRRFLGGVRFALILFLVTVISLVNLSNVAQAELRTRCQGDHPDFPSILSIATSKVVQEAMDLDWKAGLTDQLERGRWILWNKQTGEFSVSAVKVGDPTTGDKEVDIGSPPPDTSNVFTVGMYHTHPPNPKYKDVGPSDADKGKATLAKIPSLVRDSNPDTPDPNDYQNYLVGPAQACEDPENANSSVKLPNELFQPANQGSGNSTNNGTNGTNGTNGNDNGGNNSSGNASNPANSGDKGTGSSYGDPHIITLDGFRYSFQTVGEFLLEQSTDGKFIVQTRQEKVPKQELSLNTAVAVKVGSDRIGYYAPSSDKSEKATLRVNGEVITLKDETVKLPDGGFLQKQSTEYTIESPRGEQVIIRPIKVANLPFVNVTVTVPNNYQGQMTGLLGDFDRNTNNDLKTRGGKLIPSRSSYSNVRLALSNFLPIPIPLDEFEKSYFDKLYRDFGDSWRIKQEDSLFDYQSGQSTATFTDRNFPKRYHNIASLMPNQIRQAETVCRQAGVNDFMLEGCILDVGFTGETGFAKTMVNVLTNTVVDRAVNRALDEVRSRVKVPAPFRIPGFPF
ncbi:MAG: VWD domain-containing protein [Trichormus sp.]